MSTMNDNSGDPLNFVKNLWGNMGFNLPGMVTPTFDVNELEKRINDLKAVEGWLRMNLSMLQMTIQGLEMQRATLSVVQAMGDVAHKAHEGMATPTPEPEPKPQAKPAEKPAPASVSAETATDENASALSQAALWPWTLMQQVQDAMNDAAPPAAPKARAKAKPAAKRRPAAKKPAK
ncbi:MAG TPA: hypothetical protein PLW86_17845 [Rhodocyclaceae bacterium]|nr:hypothetical protein [Rhodocyclaceae bacterium]